MNEKPLVSVILPVYNGERFIGDSLISAMCQSYENLEILVVNDGSTDRTLEVAREIAREDPRVRILDQKNAGVAHARNRGIAEARGEFVATLDADDIWDPTKIECQVRRMIEAGEQTGLVYSWWVWIDVQGFVLDRSPRWSIEGDAYDKLLQVNYTGNASVPMFRRSCLAEVGGFNEELAASGAGGCEDWDVALRVAARFPVAVVPEVLVAYRRSPGSMSTGLKTMWKSRGEVIGPLRWRRPNLNTGIFRHSSSQFALHLAGISFWSGDYGRAFLWALRAASSPMPFLVSPFVLLMLARRWFLKRRRRNRNCVVSGQIFKTQDIPEASIPYDFIYSKFIWRKR